MKYSDYIANYIAEHKAKRFKQALKYVRAAILIDPKQMDAWNLLANLYYYDLGQTENALKTLTKALKYHPNHPVLLFNYALFLFEDNHYKETFETLTTVLNVDTKNTQAWDLLDKLYIAANDLRVKIDALRQNLFQNHIENAHKALQFAQINQAIEEYENAIRIIPSNEEVMDELSRMYYRIGNYAASQSYVQRLLTIHPKDVAIINLKAYNAWKMNSLEDAYDFFKESLKLKADQSSTAQDFESLKKKIAEKYQKEGDQAVVSQKYDDAIRLYQSALHFLPGSPYALQKIKDTDALKEQKIQLQQQAETQEFLSFLQKEAEVNDELTFDEILQEMPKHSLVLDVNALRNLLKQLILNKQLSAALTPSSIKGLQSAKLHIAPGRANMPSKQIYQTVALRNPNIPVLVLRDGYAEKNQYVYWVKIHNNRAQRIQQVKILLYYPDYALELKDVNPQMLSLVESGYQTEMVFHFQPKTQIFEGKIQAVISYLDENDEVNTLVVSPHNVENISDSMQPLQVDPSAFARLLQECQNFPGESEKIQVNQPPETVFQSIQQGMKQLRFHIQQSSKSGENTSFLGFIHGIAQTDNLEKPVFLEVTLSGTQDINKSEISVRATSSSNQVNKFMTSFVKSSLIMPQCPNCGQLFPLSFLTAIKKGNQIVCETCGLPYDPKSKNH